MLCMANVQLSAICPHPRGSDLFSILNSTSIINRLTANVRLAANVSGKSDCFLPCILMRQRCLATPTVYMSHTSYCVRQRCLATPTVYMSHTSYGMLQGGKVSSLQSSQLQPFESLLNQPTIVNNLYDTKKVIKNYT